MAERGGRRPRLDVVPPRAVAARGEEELTQLFSRYGAALRIFVAAIVKNEQTARELAQEACLRVLQAYRRGEVVHPRSYLFQAAANVARDHLRRQALHLFETGVELDADRIQSQAPTPEDEVSLGQTETILARVLAEMPDKTRQVFIHRRFDALPIAQIAHRMNISESMVYKHMRQALQRLLQAFPRERS
jgi:RNA polymerase sigma factor (sigma-70 family)